MTLLAPEKNKPVIFSRYHDAALGYRTLLTLLHQGHMSSSRTESYVLVSTPLPGVTLATVYVETAYSLLCCGEFSDTVTVCQHLTGRSQDGISMVKCDVEHAAAIMYEVYALVGLNDIDVALSTLDMYVLCHFLVKRHSSSLL